MGWSPTDTQLMTVTGERTDMRGKKPLRIRVKDLELVHDFWLADIQEQCIIGLDLLTRWGACVDTVGSGGGLAGGSTTPRLDRGVRTGARSEGLLLPVQQPGDPRWPPVPEMAGPRAGQRSPAAQHRVGAPMERVGGDVLGPFPVPEAENRRVLVARDCYRRLRERRQAQVSAGVRQKRACDTRCRGGAFVPGDKVWVYCPVRKRGVSPRLCGHWQGPAEVVGRLTEVVYRIRMPGPGRVAVLHQDRLSPYCPPAPAAARAGDAGGTPGSHPNDSSPVGPDLPARRRKTHGHLQDFVLGNGVVGDD
ncbi:unnamed protein product [Oreochromis niloticus]|nr:unnamed protein product [Mustela putorius furo]